MNGVWAIRGVDMSLQQCQTASLENWCCLKRNGFDFAIIEIWNGGYQYNNRILQCVQDARAAGFQYVDVYAFMCPNCRNNYPASSAIETILSRLHDSKVDYGQLWLDVEQCDGCWFGDLSANANYVTNASMTAEKYFAREGMNRRVGIYSSVYEWQQTVGGESNLSHLQLWYAHYDNASNFNDAWAYHFGGWTYPAIKQYWDHGPAECGVDVDVNFY
nr:unnamed protein product [Naegleria fowleri]